MTKGKYERDELVKSAYRHTISELGLENVKPSLRLEYENLQKAHDAIHDFMLLTALLFPRQADKQVSWHSKSAFIIYHWEAFHHAHRSLIEGLCAYYSVAFVLLRTALELVVKGAFWECLSHKLYRENSEVLDKDDWGKNIKGWLHKILELAPAVEEKFERTSGSIYDKISPIIEESEYRPNFRTIINQLGRWGVFKPIPDPTTSIYSEIYGKLSAYVHAIPDKTDIAARIFQTPNQIFDQKILQDKLSEYTYYLHEVMDVAVLITLNIMEDLINQYDEAKTNLRERLKTIEELGLKYSLIRAKILLG